MFGWHTHVGLRAVFRTPCDRPSIERPQSWPSRRHQPLFPSFRDGPLRSAATSGARAAPERRARGTRVAQESGSNHMDNVRLGALLVQLSDVLPHAQDADDGAVVAPPGGGVEEDLPPLPALGEERELKVRHVHAHESVLEHLGTERLSNSKGISRRRKVCAGSCGGLTLGGTATA